MQCVWWAMLKPVCIHAGPVWDILWAQDAGQSSCMSHGSGSATDVNAPPGVTLSYSCVRRNEGQLQDTLDNSHQESYVQVVNIEQVYGIRYRYCIGNRADKLLY